MSNLLSVCMIVKNEETVLERCLQSIHGIADEIIIVDTGSSDGTKNIAANYTGKIYDFEWVKNFAKARNYAASKATAEWILVIDADEYVDRNSFKDFKRKLALYPPKHDINAVQIVNFTGENANLTALNRHTRLYRNNKQIEYHRPIHEILRHKEGECTLGLVELQIYHSGYMKDTVEEKQKTERNLSILLEQGKKTGIDYFYIGNEYNRLGEMKKAIQYYQTAYKNRESVNADYITKLLVFLIDALYREKRYDEALDIIKGCEEAYPNYVDYKYYKGLIFFTKKEYQKAKPIFEYILANKNSLIVDHSVEHKELLPLIHLATMYESENKLQKAVEYYSKAIALNDSNDTLWIKLLYILGKHSSLEELSQFINERLVPVQGMTEQRMIKLLLNVPLLDVQKLSRSLLEHKNLIPIENDALWIKNYLLDHNFEEVKRILKDKTIGEMVVTLNTTIFTVADYIIYVNVSGDNRHMDILYQISIQTKINNILNLLFKEKHKKMKLSRVEEILFVSIYRQAKILRIDNIISILSKKTYLLNQSAKDEVKKINTLL